MTSNRLINLAPVAAVALIGLVAVTLTTSNASHRGGHPIWLALVLTETTVAMLLRRRHPVGALAGVLVASLLFDVLSLVVAPALLALFTVAQRRSRATAVAAGALTAAVLVLTPAVHGDSTRPMLVALLVAAAALATAAGDHWRETT
jgi:hypothetical protein